MDQGPGLAPPMWAASTLQAALATVLICWPAWPGHMGYDPLFAYQESITGISTMTWPPLHAYMFWLSRKVGLGAGGVFATQTFLLFLAAGLSISLLVRSRRLALLAMGLFALAFVAIPPLLGVAMSLWRDVPTATLALGGLALWLLAARRQSLLLLVATAACVGLDVALRYNAFPLFLLTAPLMLWRPWLGRPAGARPRLVAAAALVVSLGLAWASTHWRLPDLKHVPAAQTTAAIQLFDLLGVTSCSGVNRLPAGVTEGWPITVAQVREAYDPRHLNMAFREIPDQPAILSTDAHGVVHDNWVRMIGEDPGCYLTHRFSVFLEQMGMVRRDVFYPVHGGIDPNPHGLALAHPALSNALTDYVARTSPDPWRRPALLYLLAALAMLLLLARRHPQWLLAVALLGGAFANVALLFLIGPAADARYIFPSNVVCAFLIAWALAAALERRDAPS